MTATASTSSKPTGLRRGHLVYAAGTPTATYHVENTDIEIVRHVLDLDQPPRDLLAAVDQLAGLVAQ